MSISRALTEPRAFRVFQRSMNLLGLISTSRSTRSAVSFAVGEQYKDDRGDFGMTTAVSVTRLLKFSIGSRHFGPNILAPIRVAAQNATSPVTFQTGTEHE